MSAQQQQIHNIFAEETATHNDDEHDAYGRYAIHVADTAGANAGHDTHEEEEMPPPLPHVMTNLYNAAVMPHAQMLLQAATGGHHNQQQQRHALNEATTAGGIINNMQYAATTTTTQRNNQMARNQPMNIFDAAEDAYAQHIADLHAANQYSTAQNNTTASAANNNRNSATAAADGRPIPPILPPIYPKNIGMPETVIPPKWMARYNELKRYKLVHGDCSVPQGVPEHKQLNAWARTQKQQYKLMKEGKHSHMSQARVDLLDEIGFEWGGVKRNQFWQDRYNELADFHARNGHTRVPEKYPAAPQLHTWLSLQRRQLKLKREGKKNKLTDGRLKLLEALGMECQIRNTSTWMDRFAELKGMLLNTH